MPLLQATNGYSGFSQACMGNGIIIFIGEVLQFTQVTGRENRYEIRSWFVSLSRSIIIRSVGLGLRRLRLS